MEQLWATHENYSKWLEIEYTDKDDKVHRWVRLVGKKDNNTFTEFMFRFSKSLEKEPGWHWRRSIGRYKTHLEANAASGVDRQRIDEIIDDILRTLRYTPEEWLKYKGIV